MKIVLVQPPNLQRTGKWEEQKTYRPPLGLATLAAYIEKYGYEVSIVDLDVEGLVNPKEAANRIMSSKPDVVGFTCLTPRYPVVINIAKEYKKISDVITVVGGPHITGLPKYALKDESIDYGIIGEGEGAFLDLIGCIRYGNKLIHNISNLIFRFRGSVIVNEARPYIDDIDTIPHPNWGLLDLNYYREPDTFKKNYLGIMSSRGCPYNCIFCASKTTWGRKVRLHSSKYVVDELEMGVSIYGINEFLFYDDTFTINKQRVMDICNEIKSRGLNIRFTANARADTIDYSTAMILKDAGCFMISLGIESGDPNILKVIKKGITKEQSRLACESLRKADLAYYTCFILGHPSDTHESIKATINFTNELDPAQAKFMISTPYPGTELYDMAVKKGLLPSDGALDLGEHTYFQHVVCNMTDGVTNDELLKYQQDAYDNYDKRKRILV